VNEEGFLTVGTQVVPIFSVGYDESTIKALEEQNAWKVLEAFYNDPSITSYIFQIN